MTSSPEVNQKCCKCERLLGFLKVNMSDLLEAFLAILVLCSVIIHPSVLGLGYLSASLLKMISQTLAVCLNFTKCHEIMGIIFSCFAGVISCCGMALSATELLRSSKDSVSDISIVMIRWDSLTVDVVRKRGIIALDALILICVVIMLIWRCLKICGKLKIDEDEQEDKSERLQGEDKQRHRLEDEQEDKSERQQGKDKQQYRLEDELEDKSECQQSEDKQRDRLDRRLIGANLISLLGFQPWILPLLPKVIFVCASSISALLYNCSDAGFYVWHCIMQLLFATYLAAWYALRLKFVQVQSCLTRNYSSDVISCIHDISLNSAESVKESPYFVVRAFFYSPHCYVPSTQFSCVILLSAGFYYIMSKCPDDNESIIRSGYRNIMGLFKWLLRNYPDLGIVVLGLTAVNNVGVFRGLYLVMFLVWYCAIKCCRKNSQRYLPLVSMVVNILVIVTRCVIQLLNCEVPETFSCYVKIVLNLRCIYGRSSDENTDFCGVSVKEASLTMDIMLFVILLVQLRVSKPEKLENTSKPEKLENTSKPEKLENTSKPEKLENTSKPEKLENASKPEKLENTSKPEKLKKISPGGYAKHIGEIVEAERETWRSNSEEKMKKIKRATAGRNVRADETHMEVLCSSEPSTLETAFTEYENSKVIENRGFRQLFSDLVTNNIYKKAVDKVLKENSTSDTTPSIGRQEKDMGLTINDIKKNPELIMLFLKANTETLWYFSIIIWYIKTGSALSMIFCTLFLPLLMLFRNRILWNVITGLLVAIILFKYSTHMALMIMKESGLVDHVFHWKLLVEISKPQSLNCKVFGYKDACVSAIIADDNQYHYSVLEVLALCSMLWHDSVLKEYGIWGMTSASDQSKILKSDEEKQAKSDQESVEREGATADQQSTKGNQGTAHQPVAEDKNATEKKGCFARKWPCACTDVLFYKQDYHKYMYICDFISLLITVVCIGSFSPPYHGSIKNYIIASNVPLVIISVPTVQLVLMAIDRVIFICQSEKAKLSMLLFLLLVVHIYTFAVIPLITYKPFASNLPVQFWYFFKSVYFLLSIWQIRYGYITSVTEYSSNKSYNVIAQISCKLFSFIPLLKETRSIIDWMCTPTSLSVWHFLLLDDLYEKIFLRKCSLATTKGSGTKRGKPKHICKKLSCGLPCLILVAVGLCGPIFLYSIKIGYLSNRVSECTASISVNGFKKLLELHTEADGTASISSEDFQNFKDYNSKNSMIEEFLTGFDNSDVTLISLTNDSGSIWTITQPSLNHLITLLKGENPLKLRLTLTFKTERYDENPPLQFTHEMDPSIRKELLYQLTNSHQANVFIPNFFPRYIYLPKQNKPEAKEHLNCQSCTQNDLDLGRLPYSSLELSLNNQSNQLWWSVKELSKCTQDFTQNCNKTKIKHEKLFLVVFSEEDPPTFRKLLASNFVLAGFYITVIYAAYKMISAACTRNLAEKVMLEELPDVDKILHVFDHICFVRHYKGDSEPKYNTSDRLKLEEDLCSILIFLLRSPDTLRRWTKKSTGLPSGQEAQ